MTIPVAIGYAASIIIVISISVKSFMRFRVLNLIGSTFFVIYGLLIEAYPVALLNSFSAIANIVYLIHHRYHKDYFRLVPFDAHSAYLTEFLIFYKDDIKKFFPHFQLEHTDNLMCFYILRNMSPAGVFIIKKDSDDSAEVLLDYVTKEYRDFKVGHFIYSRCSEYFTRSGIHKLYMKEPVKYIHKYLRSMGYTSDGTMYSLNIHIS